MKRRFVPTLLAALAATALLMVAVSPAQAQQQPLTYRNYTVELVPNRNARRVEIPTPPRGYANGQRRNGYVGFGPNEAGWTTFVIRGQRPGATCADDRGRGAATWVITRLELTGTGDATTEKGAGFGNPTRESWIWKSFMLVDRDDGVLFEADRDTAPTYLQIFNANAHDEALGEKFIYYRLQLTPCEEGGAPIEVDPVWGNGGRR